MEVHRVALVSAGACGGGTGFLPVLPKNAHERGSGALRLRSRARVHWFSSGGGPPPPGIQLSDL